MIIVFLVLSILSLHLKLSCHSRRKIQSLKAIKRIIRYLKGTEDYGLWYKKGGNLYLKAFTNVDWARSVDERKSTSGRVFFLGKRLVSWTSKKQDCIS